MCPCTRIFDNFPSLAFARLGRTSHPADAWTVVEEFAAAKELREIDGATILAPLTADTNDEEAQMVENVPRDDVIAKLEEMQRRWPASTCEMMPAPYRRTRLLSGPRVRAPPPLSTNAGLEGHGEPWPRADPRLRRRRLP